MSKICYICGNQFNNNDVKNHEEHIIQQSIGGRITAYSILCEKCGKNLGNSIDKPFSDMFLPFTVRLNLNFDRKRNVSLKGKLNGREVIWKDNKVYPLKPFHLYSLDKKEVIIYANQKQAKSYKQKVENEINENFDNNKPTIIIKDDLEGIVSFPINLDNKIFKKGLDKIAVEFALKNGIDKKVLTEVLEFKSKHAIFKEKMLVVPYYPLSVLDKLIEIQKDDFYPYPFHNLILFSIENYLICYIELFSTFQHYILLSKNYDGKEIYKTFIQQLIKEEDYIATFGRRYYKERNLYLSRYSITEEYLEKKYNEYLDNVEKDDRWLFEQKIIIPQEKGQV